LQEKSKGVPGEKLWREMLRKASSERWRWGLKAKCTGGQKREYGQGERKIGELSAKMLALGTISKPVQDGQGSLRPRLSTVNAA